MRRMVIWLPGTLLPGMNGKGGLLRSHWAERKKERDAVYWIILSQLERPRRAFTRPVLIKYLRLYAKQPMDWDNMGASFKWLGDALTRAGVLKDDDPKHIFRIILDQVKVQHLRDQGTRLHIREVK